ncbi:hypothetical protein QE152_g3988 [Popillia japonica]|uniref:Uncharacterized protein n=1 Tax=Popillia japonica TaxID=7064 RepID=A0AAW1N2L1_POPJA
MCSALCYKALNDRCAPLYADEKPCCPAYFSCPDGTETITRSSNPSSADGTETITRSSNPSSDVSCKFGDHEIMAGDEVVLKNPFLATCKCAVPPLITCRTEVPYGTLLRKYYS